ncbi:hypothetical protein, partial [Kingella kingae]|uniref:hypothetical protein n=1 Tax=Kingella kingae TaxID=504 RepID=UPI00057142D8
KLVRSGAAPTLAPTLIAMAKSADMLYNSFKSSIYRGNNMVIVFFIGLFFMACIAIGTVIGAFFGGLELIGTIKGYDVDEDDIDDELIQNG